MSVGVTTNVLLEAALTYAEKGWAVFPCGIDKKPLVAGGFKSASTDPEQIQAWWAKYPEASIGCPTGSQNGMWVLDVDLPNGPESLAAFETEHGRLPATMEQRTGSGGRHLFFKWVAGREIRNSASKLASGLDVRGDGGYVILPPSGHPSGGTYAWQNNSADPVEAPEWALDIVAPSANRQQAQTQPPSTSASGKTSAYAHKALAEEANKVAGTSEGSRNHALNAAAYSLGQLVAGGELTSFEVESELLEAALLSGLPEAEARQTITSGMTAGKQEPRTAPVAQRNAAHSSLSDLFSVRTDGVYFREVDKDGNPEFHWVCSPLRILSRTRNTDSQEWGILLEVMDSEGKPHRWAMPARLMAGYGDTYRSELLDMGLRVAPGTKGKQRLELYLSTAKVETFARCVDRIGWQDEVFVLPDEVIGNQQSEEVVLQGFTSENSFRQQGTLAEWQEHIGRLCTGNSRLALTVSASLAAPLLEPLGAESGGLHLVGGSSLGKTTALRIAGSVCGGGPSGFIKQWRATDNGLEGIAATHCDALLCLDEMGQANSKVVSESAYMLANGQGKARAGRNGQSRKAHSWRLLFCSTGEVTLEDKLTEEGRGRAKAGQSVRVVDIPADAGVGHGLFEDLHGFANADLFARHLKEASGSYYGTALRAFLKALVADRERLSKRAQELMRSFEAIHCPKGADGQVLRVCGRFALIAAAGELGAELGILPWQPGEATKAAATCLQAWIDLRGGTGAAELTAGVEQVRRFFQAHGSSRFEETGLGAHSVSNRAGYRREKNGKTEYLVFPEVFRKEVCAGFNLDMLCNELTRVGILSAGWKNSPKNVRIPSGQKKMYVLTDDILAVQVENTDDEKQADSDSASSTNGFDFSSYCSQSAPPTH